MRHSSSQTFGLDLLIIDFLKPPAFTLAAFFSSNDTLTPDPLLDIFSVNKIILRNNEFT
jgi:hypothetical protein